LTRAEQALNALHAESYLGDLKDDADYRQEFLSQIEREISNNERQLNRLSDTEDDYYVVQAVIAWFTEA